MITENKHPTLVISDLGDIDQGSEVPGEWRGFSDQVMGGVSDAEFGPDSIEGMRCIRLRGHVTRDQGGGFVQMARELGIDQSGFDASAYKGLELTVWGNNESYNVHLRTADTGWHDESYRASFKAKPEWQTIRLPWSSFKPNAIDKPLDTAHLRRIGLLGWMREFEADLALSRLAFFP